MDRDRIQPKKERHGWYCRGYLPHLDWPTVQFITFRQFDSLPQSLLDEWRDELRFLSKSKRKAEEYRRVEAYINQGSGSCLLVRPELAAIVESKLLEFHDRMLDLKGWVIMPNHVHLLAGFTGEVAMAKVIADLKGSTAREINKLRGVRGSFWYRDFYDRFIRDQDHFENTLGYIHRNPVAAKLCGHFLDFPFSSARFLYEREGDQVYEARRLNPALPVRDSNGVESPEIKDKRGCVGQVPTNRAGERP